PMWARKTLDCGSDRRKVRRTYCPWLASHTTAVTESTRLLSDPYVVRGIRTSPAARTAVPCAATARTPPKVTSPGAGTAVRPYPASSRRVSSVSIRTPVSAVTAPGAIVTFVRWRVVSRRTFAAHVDAGAMTRGDQVCAAPRARILYPFFHAQLATVTTSAGVRGAQVHAGSSAISPDQFSK